VLSQKTVLSLSMPPNQGLVAVAVVRLHPRLITTNERCQVR